jgi:uncharacterized membrane protein
MDWYDITKWLHILGSTVLFGTGAGTAFQMVMAMRGGDPAVIAAVARNVVIADWVFTTPAGILQPITGITLVYLTGVPLTEPWLLIVYALYVLAFVAWVPVVWLQHRIRDLAAQSAAAGQPLCEKSRTHYRLWFALGWPAFMALLGVFWLMVSRPQF